MKKILILWFLAISTLGANESMKKVYINQIVNHPALDKTVKGIIDGLEQAGYKQGVNLDLKVESAQGSAALSSQIALKFVNANADVVVGIGTTSAQSFLKYSKEGKTKLIFSSITDPISAGLVANLNNPGGNVSGVSNFIDLKDQINFFKTLQPNLKRIGLIYNPSEANSVVIVKRLKEIAPSLGVEIILQAANKTSDVPQAATSLVNKVDAIFISNDNTAFAAIAGIIAIATKANIPVYVSDTDAVSLGALAAMGPNQYNIGLQSAKMIVKVLKGENIGGLPVEFPITKEIYINEQALKKFGITLPKNIKANMVRAK